MFPEFLQYSIILCEPLPTTPPISPPLVTVIVAALLQFNILWPDNVLSFTTPPTVLLLTFIVPEVKCTFCIVPPLEENIPH